MNLIPARISAALMLGVVLEKPGHYRIGGQWPEPGAADIGQSIRVAYAVAALRTGVRRSEAVR